MGEDSCVFGICLASTVPLQQAIWKHRRTISVFTTAAFLTGNIMALYLYFKSSVFAAVQYLYLFIVCDPPRFYILLLLLFILFIILAKSGTFGEETIHVTKKSTQGGEHRPIFSTYFSFNAGEILCESDMEEELDMGLDMEKGTSAGEGPENNNQEQNNDVDADDDDDGENEDFEYDDDDDDDGGEDEDIHDDNDDAQYTSEDEDLEELNERVEAFIRKVQMGFSMEALNIQ